jgi:hypothetical protein
MGLYQESTKTRPLLFFESFIDNDKLIKYEDMFYEYSFNLSQENFREQGYIKYFQDSYEDEPATPIIEYFKNTLNRLLVAQVCITQGLLEDRRNELEYQNISTDIFIQRQLLIVNKLKTASESLAIYKDLFQDTLNQIEINLKAINPPYNRTPEKAPEIKRSNPFFEPKDKITITHLKKLYEIAVDKFIVDDQEVFEETFIAVFSSNKPELLKEKIYFSCNNLVATFYLNCIMWFFKNLSHSSITKSKSFHNKQRKLLNQNDLDKAENYYKKKRYTDTDVFIALKKDIESIKPKQK